MKVCKLSLKLVQAREEMSRTSLNKFKENGPPILVKESRNHISEKELKKAREPFRSRRFRVWEARYG